MQNPNLQSNLGQPGKPIHNSFCLNFFNSNTKKRFWIKSYDVKKPIVNTLRLLYYTLKQARRSKLTALYSKVWNIKIGTVYLQPEIRNRKKGTGLFPSAFYQTQQSMTALEQVQKILEPLLTEDVFLVEMKVKPTNNIKIYLDARGIKCL